MGRSGAFDSRPILRTSFTICLSRHPLPIHHRDGERLSAQSLHHQPFLIKNDQILPLWSVLPGQLGKMVVLEQTNALTKLLTFSSVTASVSYNVLSVCCCKCDSGMLHTHKFVWCLKGRPSQPRRNQPRTGYCLQFFLLLRRTRYITSAPPVSKTAN